MHVRSTVRISLAAVLCLLAAPASSPAAAQTAYVRLNQLGFEAGIPARAYLLSTVPAEGAKFAVVKSGGAAVSSAAVGASTGTWGKLHVYSLDFKIVEPGTYTIAVTGPVTASSPAFQAGAGKGLYAGALANSLAFYRNQRDGEKFVRSPLRSGPAHLNDRKAKVYASPTFEGRDKIVGDLKPTGAVIDVEGGWFDAGDYLKFVTTESYVAALMLTGVRDFPNQMGAGSSTSDFTGEAKFGLDWLQKMWDDRTRTLYYQVGLGSEGDDFVSDHGIWRIPEVDDTYGGTDPKTRYIRNRPVLIAGPAGSPISPNIAGRLAADFALCYSVFAATDRAYADRCLASAQHVFELADTAPEGSLLTAAPFGFYGEREWRDDLQLGATEIYLAMARAKGKLPAGLPHSDPAFYLKAAAHWANEYVSKKDTAEPLNLYDVSGLAHFELHRALSLAGKPAGLGITQEKLLAALKATLAEPIATAAKDPFGFGFPWSRGDTATRGAGLAVMAKQIAYLTGDATYDKYARQWVGNVLGANSWGTSFIVGNGADFTHCVHHQIANLVGSFDGKPPVLAGAVVEGPNRRGVVDQYGDMKVCPPDGGDRFAAFNGNGAVFVDDSRSYVTAEPAIDLTAPSFLTFSWLSAGAPAEMP